MCGWYMDKSLTFILLFSRFKPEHRHALNINLCKPFAAHCIGFPIVTFSFSEIRNCYFSFVSVGCNKGTRKSSQDLFSSFGKYSNVN